MPKPSLRRILEGHFHPKWFWRKQKYVVCNNISSFDSTWYIYGMPKSCAYKHAHTPTKYAAIHNDKIVPTCIDQCPEILAADPKFFQKLDTLLRRDCHEDE